MFDYDRQTHDNCYATLNNLQLRFQNLSCCQQKHIGTLLSNPYLLQDKDSSNSFFIGYKIQIKTKKVTLSVVAVEFINRCEDKRPAAMSGTLFTEQLLLQLLDQLIRFVALETMTSYFHCFLIASCGSLLEDER